MGLTDPVSCSPRAYKASRDLTAPLVADIANQDQAKSLDIFKVIETKYEIKQSNRAWLKQMADETYEKLSLQLRCWPRKRVHHRGCLCSHYLTMVSPSTREPSEMQSVSDMAGLCLILHPNAVVVSIFQQIML